MQQHDKALPLSPITVGDRFGRLTVVSSPLIRFDPAGRRKIYYATQCECCTPREVHRNRLLSGHTRSCGCLSRDTTRQRETEHGETGSKLHRLWAHINYRCRDPRAKSYPNYGGRGITVCPEWRTSYVTFREWATSAGYQPGLTIERIDNDGPYAPGNCCWATRHEQARNKRNNHLYLAFGEQKVLAAWTADPRCVVGFATLKTRVFDGWNIERAMTQPSRAMRQDWRASV